MSDSDVGANFYAYEKFFKADGWTIDSFRNLVDRNQYGFIESSKGGEKITLAVNIPPLAAGKYIPVNSTPGLVVFKGYSFVTITYTR
ncbi:MAG: hypothetical protein M1275_02795 [Patescibacteria group bacterium]|nr:hypothetical protein [Patescibacteria group bacterium]